MKNTFVLITIILFTFCNLRGQSPERPKKEIPLLSEVVSTLDNATGWILQNNGEWVSSTNKIPFREYEFNKINRGRYALGRENFTSIEIRQVTIKEMVYSIMVIKFEDGKYDFPMLEQDWQGFKTLKYYAFKESKWNSVFPDSMPTNKPFAVNMQLLTSGTIPKYNEKTYLFEIENAVQKAIYLQEESVSNLIFAVYPVEINGQKLIRFKYYETINKFEIYIKFMLEHNWLKLFRNAYYEIDFAEFANFIINIGVVNPNKLNSPGYYRMFFDSGIKKYQEEKFVTALQLFTKAADVNPPDSSLISIFLWKGKSKIKLRQFNEAIADFSFALNRVPHTDTEKKDWVENYYQRGNAYHEIHDFSNACLDWHKALELGFADALKPIKKTCGKTGDLGSLAINLKKAEKYYNKALKFYNKEEFLKSQFLFELSWQNNPMNDNYEIPYYIGMCRFRVGDYVRAIDDFDKAYKIKPEKEDTMFEGWQNVLVWRGKALQQCGYLDDACEDWTEAQQFGNQQAEEFLQTYCYDYKPKSNLTNTNKMSLVENGITMYEHGDFQAAIDLFDQAEGSNRNADNFQLLTYRASARFKIKDYSGSVADFTKAISIKPTNDKNLRTWCESFYNRGISKYFLNDIPGACRDWQAALKTGIHEATYPLSLYCTEDFQKTEPEVDLIPENFESMETVIEENEPTIEKTNPENSEKPVEILNQNTIASPDESISKTEVNPIEDQNPVQPVKVETPQTANNTNCTYHVIVGAFMSLEKAQKLTETYKNKGYDSKIIQKPGKDFYLVSLFCSNNKADAQSKIKELKATFPDSYIFAQ